MAPTAEDGRGDRVEGFCNEDMMTSCTISEDAGVVSMMMKDKEMKKRDDVRDESGITLQQQQQPGNESTGERLLQEKILLAVVNNSNVKEWAEDEGGSVVNAGEATNEKERDNNPSVGSDDLGKDGSSKISVCTSPSLERKPKDAKTDSEAKGVEKSEETAAVLSKMRLWRGSELHRLRLSFLKPPPTTPFEGKSFEVECVLCNENATSAKALQSLSSRKVRIFPTVLTPEGKISDYPLELESTAISWKDGGLLATLKFHANVLKSSAPISSRRVCLMLSTEYGLSDEDGGEPREVIKLDPLVSDTFVIVKHALEIVDGKKPIPDQWFKDEGGRDNCVEFGVRLVDSEGRAVLDRNIQLHLTLLYRNMHPVANQDILKVFPFSEWSLNPQSDGAKSQSGVNFRVRIEEVSRHHQKQAFRIRVAAEPVGHECTLDIRPGPSKPIVVLSKRITRKTKQKAEHKGRPDQNWGNVQLSPTRGVSSQHNRSIGQNNIGSKIGKRRTSTDQAVTPRGKVHGVNVPMDYGFVEPTDMSPSAFHRALKNVISWSKEVVNTLMAIEWKLIGYETLPNNQSNLDRPLYRISDPNPLIANLLNMYATETTQCLHMLLMYYDERGGMDREQIPIEQHLNVGAGVEGSGSSSSQPGGVHVDPQSMAQRNIGQHFLLQHQAQKHQALSMQQQQQRMKYGKSAPAFMPCEWGGSNHEFQQEWHRQHAEAKQGFQVNKRTKRDSTSLGEDKNLVAASLVQNVAAAGLQRGGRQCMPPDSTVERNEMTKQYGEGEVYCILAQGYVSPLLGPLGFPAYNYQKCMVGVYRGAIGGLNGNVAEDTRLVFVPTDRIQGLSSTDTEGASEVLKEMIEKGSQSVFSLQGCNKNLELMKKEALSHFLSQPTSESPGVNE